MRDSFPLVLPYLDGVILAVNACERSFLVIDGFGCHFNRAERFAGNHDLFSTLTDWRGFHRVVTSQLESADLALGSGAKLRKTIAGVVARARPEAIVITPSVTVSVSGAYYADLARELAAVHRVPVLVVEGAILESDWLDGYADTLRAMTREALAERGRRRRVRGRGRRRAGVPAVIVVGNLLARNELDELENVEEIRRLIAMAGARAAAVWLSGARYRAGRLPIRIDGVVGLPYGEAAARELAGGLGVPLCLPGLPIGFSGSMAWVRTVAAAVGSKARLDAAEEAMTDHVRRFSWAVARFLAGRAVALCADPHLARGLVPFLREVGLRIEILALESRHAMHADALEFKGVPHVLPDPTHRELKERLAGCAGALDLVVGSNHRRLQLSAAHVPFMELGVPSYQHHAFVPSPYVGFAGAAHLAQRMINLLNDAP